MLKMLERRKTTDEDQSQEDKKNAKVIAVFKGVRENGRVVNIDKGFFKKDIVDFPKPHEENSASDGWGSVGCCTGLGKEEPVQAPTGKTTTAPETLDEGESVILEPDKLARGRGR